MRAPPQRLALGALFLVLAVCFVGVAVTALDAGVWAIALPAAALGVWLASLTLASWRPRKSG